MKFLFVYSLYNGNLILYYNTIERNLTKYLKLKLNHQFVRLLLFAYHLTFLISSSSFSFPLYLLNYNILFKYIKEFSSLHFYTKYPIYPYHLKVFLNYIQYQLVYIQLLVEFLDKLF